LPDCQIAGYRNVPQFGQIDVSGASTAWHVRQRV
jgi:hypothetical protein